MKTPSLTVRMLAAFALAAFATFAHAWIRSPAVAFAELPATTAYPEGIAVDGKGNVYVANFDVGKSGGPGNIVVFNRSGRPLRVLDVQGSSNLLLGIAFHPKTGELLVCDLGGGQVLKVDPATGAATTFAVIPTIPGGTPGPNALAFDAAGNVYISDSFQGTIWKTGSGGGAVAPWLSDGLLATTGVPPFGANGMAFDKAGTTLYVANTGNDTILRVPVTTGGAAGTPEVFLNAINGADGLAMDADDHLWIAANQADEIVVVDTRGDPAQGQPPGRVLAKLGDFDGIDPRGAPRGLLFPASLVLSDGFVYVTNLALDLRLFGLPQTANSQWSADVKRYTVSRIRASIPPVAGP